MDYKAVILAGGKGTRLYPVTREIPKPLLPVNRKPIINYLVDLFLGQEIKDIAVLVNKEFEEEFVWWLKRYYPSAGLSGEPRIQLIKEEEPLGTFGGIFYLKEWIGSSPFFLTNGDELKEIDLAKMMKFHDEKKVLATVALVSVPDPQNYGVAICQNGLIKEFLEKPKDPPANFISSGLYLLSSEVLKYHPGCKFCMVEKDIFPKLASERNLAGFQFDGRWTDCGTWERYSDALAKWREG